MSPNFKSYWLYRAKTFELCLGCLVLVAIVSPTLKVRSQPSIPVDPPEPPINVPGTIVVDEFEFDGSSVFSDRNYQSLFKLYYGVKLAKILLAKVIKKSFNRNPQQDN